MKRFALAIFMATLAAVPANAAEHVVKMVNVGPDGTRMAFDPAFVRAAPGDTIVFEPVDNGHAVASVIVPDGAQPWEGDLNAPTTVTVSAPGAYLFKSKPHFAVGMIGMIVVETPDTNRAAIDAFKPRGSLMRERFEALRGQL